MGLCHELKVWPFDDCIHRTRFLTESTAGHIGLSKALHIIGSDIIAALKRKANLTAFLRASRYHGSGNLAHQ